MNVHMNAGAASTDMQVKKKIIFNFTNDLLFLKVLWNFQFHDFLQEGELSMAFLKKYINYARSRCGPRLSAEAAEKLKNKYVQMRNATKVQEEQTEKRVAIPITVRQLEAIGKKYYWVIIFV